MPPVAAHRPALVPASSPRASNVGSAASTASAEKAAGGDATCNGRGGN
eukprot:CAMPEP_0179148002 /NCGR_PEP_ID=MMETSP0796-20121207/71589_1 /TAXON_ID=73915 /ORGANISM="Pyrodinium bahamense, Strain pbaha01" /LENGTH=47 /DNA_ID= /DNA_START= /DNA_END= /DNA_ORIENTATION=